MFKGVTRLFFLIMLGGASVSMLRADLPEQLSALQGRLGALKTKLGELRGALHDLKIKFEEAGKEEAINQLVQEKAFDSFMKKISPHLNDKGFVDNIVEAFKKNGYEAFNQIAQLFPKNQINEELDQVKELFVNVYESFIDQDLKNKKFVNADEKSNKLFALEMRYNDSSLKKNKKDIIDEIVSNSRSLSVEQLEKVSGAINSDSEKKLFINLVTKALTEQCLSKDDREELAKELMMSLSSSKPDEEISKIKHIIGKDGLGDFYKNRAKMLLMKGLKGAKAKYLNKSNELLKIITVAAAKRIFPGYQNFNDLVEKLEAGLEQPLLSKQENQEIFDKLSVEGIPCEKLYEAFAQPAEHLTLLQEILKNEKLLKPHENNRSLAQRLLTKIMGDASLKDDDDWNTDDALVFNIPHWFNTIFKNDAIKKEALIDIMTTSLKEGISTDEELKVFKQKFDKLKGLEQAIQDILFGGDTNKKVSDFWDYHDNKTSKAEVLKKQIKDARDAYDKAAKEEAKKTGKTGGVGNTGLMKTLADALNALRRNSGY